MEIFTEWMAGLMGLGDDGGSSWYGKARACLADLRGFGTNPGWLRARTYIPAGLPRGAPLVVVLHGCDQNARAYNHGVGWSALAERHGFALLFPEQQRFNNVYLAFNWFAAEDSRRDGGEARSIREMIEALIIQHGIDRHRIFITGLSAGGAMTSVMLATYPEVFAGGAIIAGLPYGGAATLPQAFNRMQGRGFQTNRELEALVRNASTHNGPWPTVSIWHGSADHTVNASNAQAILGQWRSLHRVGESPSQTGLVDGYPHQVWCNASGRPLIEEYSITGMGHGAPIDTEGADGCGASGAYMLNANISSTRHIASFWGIDGGEGWHGDEQTETSRVDTPYSFMTSHRRRAPSLCHAASAAGSACEPIDLGYTG